MRVTLHAATRIGTYLDMFLLLDVVHVCSAIIFKGLFFYYRHICFALTWWCSGVTSRGSKFDILSLENQERFRKAKQKNWHSLHSLVFDYFSLDRHCNQSIQRDFINFFFCNVCLTLRKTPTVDTFKTVFPNSRWEILQYSYQEIPEFCFPLTTDIPCCTI